MDIQQVTSDYDKTIIADDILRKTPELFDNTKFITEYIDQIKGNLFFEALDGDDIVGFISLKYNNAFTAQILVIGILNVYNRKEVGRKLVQEAEKYLAFKGYRFMIFSTIGSKADYQYYIRIREFYRSLDFYPLEESKENNSDNLSLIIMAKHIAD